MKKITITKTLIDINGEPALIIDPPILEALQWTENTDLEIITEGNSIIIRAVKAQ